MKILFENVNLSSSSGPNHFASKLVKYLGHNGNKCVSSLSPDVDVKLTFIESFQNNFQKPSVLRLDGIYFDPSQNYELKNKNILRSYKQSSGVIFQSNFSKEMCFKYFGEHSNFSVIHNGADLEVLNLIEPLQNSHIDKFENVWSCAASWRRFKRLKENISYFLEHSGANDCLVVAGNVPSEEVINHERIFFVGNLDVLTLYSLYKRSKYFIHLSRYESCPNVVIDARAAGCKIICSSIAGTKEVAGPDAIVIYEEPWDYSPASTTNLPNISFDKVVKNCYNINIDMSNVSKKYENFLKETINASTKTN